MIFYFYLLVHLYLSIITCCGVTTHILVGEIARRELGDYVRTIIKNNLNAFQAGSFFPDWGYICNGFREEGESAHWPPFYFNSIEHIRLNYPNDVMKFQNKQKTSKGFEVIFSFLMGAINHGVDDVLWHGLDNQSNSMINSLAEMNWKGDSYKAHKIADLGGDIVAAHALNLYFLKSSWNIPSKDIIQIYKRMGYNRVNWFNLNRCLSIGLAAGQATKYSGRRLLGRFDTNKSPFLLNNYFTHYHGGILNMANRVVHCWNDTIGLLNNNISPSSFCSQVFNQNNALNNNKHNSRQIKFNNKSNNKLKGIVNINHRHYDVIQYNSDNSGEAIHNNTTNNNEMLYNSNQKIQCKVNKKYQQIIWNDLNYNGFGKSVQVINKKNKKYLIVSSPYNYNNFNSSGMITIYDVNSNFKVLFKINSAHFDTNFASNMLVLDFNNDSILDLIIASPKLNQLLIYYGNNNNNTILDSKPILWNVNFDLNYQIGDELIKVVIKNSNQQTQEKMMIASLINKQNNNEVILYGKNIINNKEWHLKSSYFEHYINSKINIEYLYLKDQHYFVLSYSNAEFKGALFLVQLDSDFIPISDTLIPLTFGSEMFASFGYDFVIWETNFDSFTLIVSSTTKSNGKENSIQSGEIEAIKYSINSNNQVELQFQKRILKLKENYNNLGNQLIKLDENTLLISNPNSLGEKGSLIVLNLSTSLNLFNVNCITTDFELGQFSSNVLLVNQSLYVVASNAYKIAKKEDVGDYDNTLPSGAVFYWKNWKDLL
ncbi:hypothetical protein K502DRAFT_364515 [Neoconidiobolus thromboides FSU 785]|nr:hypothetical protein K502DRAFT_364515 [Neoconidiobolus thromboides FSU 785]